MGVVKALTWGGVCPGAEVAVAQAAHEFFERAGDIAVADGPSTSTPPAALSSAVALAGGRLTLPVDFISCPTCLVQVERLIAAADGFVDVVVDFEGGHTTVEYPAPVVDPRRSHQGNLKGLRHET